MAMNVVQPPQVPNCLTLTEVNQPGIQRIVLKTAELYSKLEDHHQFEARLNEFLKIDTTSKIMDYSDGVLTYLEKNLSAIVEIPFPPAVMNWLKFKKPYFTLSTLYACL
jgi:hypothetical protein